MTGRSLVTGASGFLGQHLALRLAGDGERVTALLRSTSAGAAVDRLQAAGVEIVRFDHADEVGALARAAAPDRVFHLATHYLKAHTEADVPALVDANVTFGARLLEGLRETDASIVSAMSFFQFRGGEYVPASLYAATKQAFNDIAEYYRVVLGMRITQVVLYDTFGPFDVRDKLLPHILSSVRAGGPVRLGPSAQQVNLLHVDDVVAGLLAAAGTGNAAVCTLRAPRTVSVGDLVDEVSAVVGRPIDAVFNESGSTNALVAEAGDWPAPVGWVPAQSLRDGLAATWAAEGPNAV